MSKRPRDASSAASEASVVRLNVGGTIYTTTLDTLRAVPDSLFGRMFDPDLSLGMVPTDEDGNIFFDRDPEVFRWVLDFLRRRGRSVGMPRHELRPLLRDEADYFGLVGLVKACDADQQRAQSSGPPTLADLHARRAALIEIKEDGFMVGLKAVGYTCEEAKAAGYSLQEMKAAGFSCSEANAAGYSLKAMKAAGYLCSEAKAAGYSMDMVKSAGYTHQEAVIAGYPAGYRGSESSEWRKALGACF
jgi:hypothetical protein